LTQDDALYRFRLRALAPATELGNVRAARRAMGIHPSTFYRWRAQMLRFGPEPVDEQWKVVELRVKASVGLDPLRPSFGLWWGGRSGRGRTRSPPAFGDRPRENLTGERSCYDPWPGYTPLPPCAERRRNYATRRRRAER